MSKLRSTFLSTLLVSSLMMLGSQANGANTARLYDFEEGTAGGTAMTAQDKVDDLFIPAGGTLVGFYWLDVPGNAARPLPAGGIMDGVNSTALAAPSLNSFTGSITFEDVSDGSAKDSPQLGSTLAASFGGSTVFDDFNMATGLGGSRGVYVDIAGYDNNDAVVSGTNTLESFSLLTQAWVRPDSSAKGTAQVVWQAGTEQGTIQISADAVPVWEIPGLGGAFPDGGLFPAIPVVFDDWTHIGIFRGGNGAELYINGELVIGDRNPTPAMFFGAFSSIIALGGDEFGANGFTGLIDDFKVSGLADGSLGSGDMDYCLAFPGAEPCPPVVLPLTCDFDGDGDCDFVDIDDLYANFGTTAAPYDINGDSAVNAADIGEWLAAASAPENTFNTDGSTYVLGDVNLDGAVDSTDLGLLLNNFDDTSGLLFGAGNQNDDANVDSTDLGLLLNNFDFPNAAAAASVPEPALGGWMLLVTATCVGLRRRRS